MKNADGQTAVLVSPGYGCGWSTWASEKHHEFLTMDNTLVEMAQRGAKEPEVDAYLKSCDVKVYTSGWRDIEIAWLEPGTSFMVEEHDGDESIRTTANLRLST